MENKELKILKNTDKGKKLSALMKEIKRCDKASDKLAISLKCKSYVPLAPSPEADFGGIAGFYFEQKVDKKIWEPVDEKQKIYIPRVNVKTKIMEEEKALAMTGDNIKVGETSLPFSSVSVHFSREESAKMAKVKLTTPSVEQVCKSLGARQSDINKIRIGIPVEMVVKDATEEDLEKIRLAQKEDMEIMSAMENKKFRSVFIYSGKKEAIEIMKKMMNLPVVPNGAINRIMDIANEKVRPGIREEEDHFVVIIPDSETNC